MLGPAARPLWNASANGAHRLAGASACGGRPLGVRRRPLAHAKAGPPEQPGAHRTWARRSVCPSRCNGAVAHSKARPREQPSHTGLRRQRPVCRLCPWPCRCERLRRRSAAGGAMAPGGSFQGSAVRATWAHRTSARRRICRFCPWPCGASTCGGDLPLGGSIARRLIPRLGRGSSLAAGATIAPDFGTAAGLPGSAVVARWTALSRLPGRR
jgi:hypothetical protein